MPTLDTRRWAALTASPTTWAVAVAAFVLQLPLVLNPGYFSHDELQWAHFAMLGHGVDWLDFATFQYRPLTFTLWMWLSRHLFDMPQAFHAVLVAWGTANAAAVFAIGRRTGVDARAAAAGALVFALGPYAVLVHGWVGTIADLAWLSCALAIAWVGLRARSLAVIALVAMVATAIGLLAKEAALSIPLLAAVAWAFTRERRWAAATLGAVVAMVAYLALRLDVLLHTQHVPDVYAAKLSNVVVRWVEYQLFSPMVRVAEAHQTLTIAGPRYVVVSALLWCTWLAATWRASRRLAAFAIVAGGAALGPVLLLGTAWNHYGYGFAAIMALCGAAAWTRTARWGRMALGTYGLLTVLHGIVVMGLVFEVGRVQAVFSPALADALRTRAADAPPLRLRPAPDARAWMFVRLTHDIPAYAGVPIGDRMQLVGASDPADRIIAADGRLLPAAR